MKQVAGSSEEELADMQRRFNAAELDRKAFYEMTQNTIRQNKEIYAQCKREHRDLRNALNAVQKADGNVNATEDGALENLQREVNTLRKQYDEVKGVTLERQKEEKALRDEHRDLVRDLMTDSPQQIPLQKQTRLLENRLDKAMIKYNEALSIRRTYEQIVKRLKEERIGFDNQLAAIERTLCAKDRDHEELMLMSHDATHAKEVSKAELARLEEQFQEERKQREKELGEKRHQLQQKVEMSQRMEKREKMRRDLLADTGGDMSAEREEMLQKRAYAQVLKEQAAEGKIEDDIDKITTYEDALRRIKEATGVVDVNEVIQKFLTQDETHNNLVAMTKEAQQRIDLLNEERAQTKAKVEEIKYSGTGSLGSRRIVDEFESHLSEANAKCERNQQKYERVAKILINVKAGVEHLADMLEPIKIGAPPMAMTDDTVVEVLQFCEQKLLKLIDAVPEGTGANAADVFESSPMSAEQLAMLAAERQNNIRIPTRSRGGGRHSDHSDDDAASKDGEDDQDEVMDRFEVKKISDMMQEKANKKAKKGKKTKKARPGSAGKE